MLEASISSTKERDRDARIHAGNPGEPVYFNASSDQGILPLVELPTDIVRMVMEDSCPPLGMCILTM